MAHSIAGAFKPNRNDNLKTPRILVECLKPYFERWVERNNHTGHYFLRGMLGPTEARRDISEFTVYCPFDLETSEYVIFFKELGYKVIYSHIDLGQDFFEYEPDEPYDIIISNPPFSRKLDVFKRCNELGKPWVMLCNVMALNYMVLGKYFAGGMWNKLYKRKRYAKFCKYSNNK